jgi:hypothetical protein
MNKEFTNILIILCLTIPAILISYNVQANLNRKSKIEAYTACLDTNLQIVKENKSNFPPYLIHCDGF